MHNARAEHDGAEHGWLVHFHTGLLLGLLAIVATAFLHELPSVAALDHLGDNLAQRVYAEGQPASRPDAPKLVLLDLDFVNPPTQSSDIDRITRAIQAISLARPKMLLIDQEIQAASEPVASRFVAAVRAAAPIPVVLAAVQASTSRDGTRATVAPGPMDVLRDDQNVRFASPTLLRDADGLVRSVPRAVRLTWPDGRAGIVPSLAASLTSAQGSEEQASQEKIDFIYSLPPWAGEEPVRGLDRITESDLEFPTQVNDAVAGAIVIIGETGLAAWRDRHPTPIGMLQGTLIHANALLSAEARDVPLHAPPWWLEGLVATAAATAAGLCFLLHQRWRRHRPAIRGRRAFTWAVELGAFLVTTLSAAAVAGFCAGLLHQEFADAIKAVMEVLSVVIASLVFATYGSLMSWAERRWCRRPIAGATVRLVCYLPLALVLLLVLATAWVWWGVVMLGYGWHTATLVPVVVSGFEVLLKAGERLMRTLESGVVWLTRGAVVIALAVVAPSISEAANTDAAGEAPARMRSAHEAQGSAVHRSFSAFWNLLTEAGPDQGPTTGAGVRVRGKDTAAPLEWLPILPMEGPKMSAGSPGLVLAWRGGAPPYVVELTRRTSGDALGTSRSSDPFVWVPTFQMPAEPVVVLIRDGARHRLSATLLPADTAVPLTVPADQAAHAPARAAMALFVDGGPAWRLEALRRLAVLAPTDADAAEALAGVRRIATGSPP